MSLSKKMERYDAEWINIGLVVFNVQVDIFSVMSIDTGVSRILRDSG
jgi:hypothetical protein